VILTFVEAEIDVAQEVGSGDGRAKSVELHLDVAGDRLDHYPGQILRGSGAGPGRQEQPMIQTQIPRGASMLTCSEETGQFLRGEIARSVREPGEPGRATEHRRARHSPLPQLTHAGVPGRLAQLLA
jgi:hypothetical protein